MRLEICSRYTPDIPVGWFLQPGRAGPTGLFGY